MEKITRRITSCGSQGLSLFCAACVVQMIKHARTHARTLIGKLPGKPVHRWHERHVIILKWISSKWEKHIETVIENFLESYLIDDTKDMW